MVLIALRTHNPFFLNSASANRFLGLIKGLSALGVKTEILITEGYLSSEERSTFGKNGVRDGVAYRYVNYYLPGNTFFRRLHTYLFHYFYDSLARLRIFQLLNPHDSYLLWLSDVFFHQKIALEAKKRLKIKLFVEINEYLDIHKHHNINFLQYLTAERARKYFEKYTIPQLDGVAVITRALYNFFTDKGLNEEKLLHLPMSVDFSRFDDKKISISDIDLSQPYICYVGVLSNQKDGIDILLHAFDSIAKDYEDLFLYLFGPWHPDMVANTMFINGHIGNRVKYFGERSRGEIPMILQKARLLVLPRPDSHQAKGGFPTKLGEYLASGTPVCATKVGEIPQYLADGVNAFLAEAGSANSLEEAIRKALSDPKRSSLIGKAVKDTALLEFDSRILSRKLLNFFNTL